MCLLAADQAAGHKQVLNATGSILLRADNIASNHGIVYIACGLLLAGFAGQQQCMDGMGSFLSPADSIASSLAIIVSLLELSAQGFWSLPRRFQQDSSNVLEDMGTSWLQGKQSNWAGSPRGHHRRAQAPFAPLSGSEDEDEQRARETEVRKQQVQAEALLQPLQRLEQVVITGESLCR